MTDAASTTDAPTNPHPRRDLPAPPAPLNPRRPVVFQVTDWYVPESDRALRQLRDRGEATWDPDPKDYEVFMFGCLEDGTSITAHVTGFRPYFFVKPPPSWWDLPKKSILDKVTDLENTLRTGKIMRSMLNKTNGKREEYLGNIVPRRLAHHLVSVKPVMRKDFVGFTNGREFPFIRIEVRSLGLFNSLKRYFQDRKKDGFTLYESNIDPFLRFIHENNLDPCGWVQVRPGDFTVLPTGLDEEDSPSPSSSESSARSYGAREEKDLSEPSYTRFRARTVHAIHVSDYKRVQPVGLNRIAPLLIASFDIECTSSHGDFPVARKDYRKLAQDLVIAARNHLQNTGAHAPPATLTAWVLAAFRAPPKPAPAPNDPPATSPNDPPAGDLISTVYPKRRPKPEALREMVTPALAATLATLVRKVLESATSRAAQPGTEEPEEEDPENAGTAGLSGAALNTALMDRLTATLTKALPPLKGDEIIQIGTTVHRFGSEGVAYRHIATLRSCAAVEGAEVECYATEAELLMGWRDLLQSLDPDILTGYNIFGFDMDYLWGRAQELHIAEEFSVGLGRLMTRRTDLIEQRLSSSALGENILRYFDLDGVVMIDMLKVMQRDHKLDSFKLDHVARTFLGDQKEDLRPREIFERFLGDAEDRAVIARYCIQDCALVNRLVQKLKVLENNVGMGNVCSVPLSYLFMRGQGVKIFSLVAKECRAKNYLVPVINRYDTATDRPAPIRVPGSGDPEGEEAPEIDDGYEGAIVLDPEEGIYLEDPITVLDYSSLYPSSMIARNLSHDCFVNDDAYRGLESQGISYLTVTFDNYKGVGDKKEKTGTTSCTFAQLPNGQKGIIPSILMKLLQQRKNTRKKIEYERLVLSDGRVAIGLVRELPNDELEILNVEQADLGKGFGGHKAVIPASLVVSREAAYAPFEQAVLDALQLAYKVTANSLYGQIGAKTSPIYWKEIAACTTATGREMIMTAKDFVETRYNARVIYGDSVTGRTPVLLRDCETGNILTLPIERLAAAGSARPTSPWQPYPEFRPEDPAPEKEQHAVPGYEVWTDRGWREIVRVIRHRCQKRLYLVSTPRGCVEVTEDHSLLTADRALVKPAALAADPTLPLLYAFPHIPRGAPMLVGQKPIMTFDCPLAAQEEYLYQRGLGTPVTLSASLGPGAAPDAPASVTYTLRLEAPGAPAAPAAAEVLDITHLFMAGEGTEAPEAPLVYDLETTEGVFQAGVGELIVKNTDSIFCKFENRDEAGNVVKGREALPYAIQAGQRASKEIRSILPPPQCLEYEKTFFPFIILSKKRYVGNLYEDDANKKPKQKSMGIVLKRRDNAPIVKRLYGGIIDIMLNRNDLAASVRFLREELQRLVRGEVPLEDLIISKTLRNDYKDPTKIAHKVLADRMGARDPGNKPMVNDRIPFVYVLVGGAGAEQPKLQGDRIEHPDFIRENALVPDYRFYITNQLLKPICQIYALCVEEIEGYDRPPEYWMQWDIELSGSPIYQNPKKRKDRITALRMKEVEELLFHPYMAQLGGAPLPRKQRGPKTIGGCGGKSPKGQDPYEMHVGVTLERAEKRITCRATFDGAPFHTKAFPKTKAAVTKEYALVVFLEEVIESLYALAVGETPEPLAPAGPEDPPRPAFPRLLERGIIFKVSEKTFITTWNKAWRQRDEQKRAEENTPTPIPNNDIGALADQNQLIRFAKLMNALDHLPYQVAGGYVAP